MVKQVKIVDQDALTISFLKKVFFEPISIETKIDNFLYGVYLGVLNGSEMYALRKNGYTITKVYPISNTILKVIVKKNEGE